jgi:hypothetical protein
MRLVAWSLLVPVTVAWLLILVADGIEVGCAHSFEVLPLLGASVASFAAVLGWTLTFYATPRSRVRHTLTFHTVFLGVVAVAVVQIRAQGLC